MVLCHGYGSDGNDLIGLAPHWQNLLPTAAFVSPNAPERCGISPTGYQWFPLSRLDPHETLRGAQMAAPKLDSFLDEELARLNLTGDKLAQMLAMWPSVAVIGARHALPSHVDVLIVGAGISGIGMAYYLRKDSPQKSFAIVDARNALDPQRWRNAGWTYRALGRPTV